MHCKRQAINILGVMLIVLFGFFSNLHAEYTLSETFGENGVVLYDHGFGEDSISAVVVLADNKILVSGYVNSGAVSNLAVARFMPDGSLDPSFNYDGVLTVNAGVGNSRAFDMTVLENDKILVVGSVDDEDENLFVLQVTTDGYLDMSFGDNGRVNVLVGEGTVDACNIRVGADGSMYLSGVVADDSSQIGVISKLSSDGVLDESFGVDGQILIDNSDEPGLESFEIVEGGSLKVLLSRTSEGSTVFELSMYGPEGTIDTTFGDQGIKPLNFGTLESVVVHASDMDLSGSLYIAGSYGDSTRMAFAAKFTEDGELDESFVDGGIYGVGLEEATEFNTILVVHDKALLLGGYVAGSTGKDLLTAVVEINEQTESLPVLTLDLSGQDDSAYGVALQDDGSLVVAGKAGDGEDSDFALAQYEPQSSDLELLSGSSQGITTSGYRIVTTPVVDVTRVGAVSGGTIDDTQELSCETSCTAQCNVEDEEADEEAEDSTTCYDTCLADCQGKPTVSLRGVVYAVYNYPEYTEAEDDAEDDEDTEDSEGGLFSGGNLNSYEPVRSGQTENGSGLGTYSSDITDISPDTQYFVRAYAVLSDDTIIYGNTVVFRTSDACFIATAAYGSMLDNHVVVLRQFRDRVLSTNEIGRKIVGFYYSVSPEIADIIVENKLLQRVVQMILFPVVAGAFFILFLQQNMMFFFVCGVMTLLVGSFFRARKAKVGANHVDETP